VKQRQRDSRFQEIYERHREDVTLYVRRRVAADSVEDLVAETFLVCWRKLDQVPREPLPWLYAVARKTLANHYRTAAPRTLPAGISSPEDVFLPIESDEVLGRAFARLSEVDREVLRLVAWEQLSLRAAARVLGCSQVACRVRFHRAKRRLAMQLEELQARDGPASRRPRPEGVTS
jgi:RNA polymerase sigma-70 factor (ECF subfamily)